MQRGNGRLTPKYLLRERPVKWDPSYDLTTGTITVHVTRKAVKNFNLRVRSDGTAVMSIPWQTNRQKAQAFLDKHRYWLKRSIAQVLDKQPEAPDDGLVPSGEGSSIFPATLQSTSCITGRSHRPSQPSSRSTRKRRASMRPRGACVTSPRGGAPARRQPAT